MGLMHPRNCASCTKVEFLAHLRAFSGVYEITYRFFVPTLKIKWGHENFDLLGQFVLKPYG